MQPACYASPLAEPIRAHACWLVQALSMSAASTRCNASYILSAMQAGERQLGGAERPVRGRRHGRGAAARRGPAAPVDGVRARGRPRRQVRRAGRAGRRDGRAPRASTAPCAPPCGTCCGSPPCSRCCRRAACSLKDLSLAQKPCLIKLMPSRQVPSAHSGVLLTGVLVATSGLEAAKPMCTICHMGTGTLPICGRSALRQMTERRPDSHVLVTRRPSMRAPTCCCPARSSWQAVMTQCSLTGPRPSWSSL